MQDMLIILIGTVLVNNFVLVQMLGVCHFVGVSDARETAVAMGVATIFVLTLSGMVNHLLHAWLLAPLGLDYLRIIAFILVIAAVAQFARLFMERNYPLLVRRFGIFMPLIAINCAILGAALQNVAMQYGFIQATFHSFGAALGFSLVLLLFAALRERLAAADVPEPFKGSAIVMITAGLASLAFMGFAGLA